MKRLVKDFIITLVICLVAVMFLLMSKHKETASADYFQRVAQQGATK